MKREIRLPKDQSAELQALDSLPEDQINTTDIPEILDWSDARRGVFYRPVKQQITLRLDADVVAWFKAHVTSWTEVTKLTSIALFVSTYSVTKPKSPNSRL